MKTIMVRFVSVLLIGVILFSCQKADTGNTPNIPPFETMVVDFGKLAGTEKAAAMTGLYAVPKTNWLVSVATVGFWNLLLHTTLAVPVLAFEEAHGNIPVKTGENTWEWAFFYEGVTGTYTARLVGEKLDNETKWEMYITGEGANGFPEFLWFEGIAYDEDKSGSWILYHSPAFNEKVIRIDWKKEGEEVGEVKYSYIRELNNERQPDPFNGSYLAYGLQDEVFDAFVNIHVYNFELETFTDTDIEWSREDFSGRIRAEHVFNDTEWHCWDAEGNDTDCN